MLCLGMLLSLNLQVFTKPEALRTQAFLEMEVLLEPQYFSLGPPACMHWPQEMHKQEFAVQKQQQRKNSLMLNRPIWR